MAESATALEAQMQRLTVAESWPEGQEFVDLSLGEREFVEADRARELLQVMLADGAKITKMRLSTKSFSPDAAMVAADAIANCSETLLDVDLSDIIAGREEAVALEVYTILAGALSKITVTHLNISDNALGVKGLTALAACLRPQTSLQSLLVHNVGASAEACHVLSETLPETSQLARLQLYNNMSGDEGAQHIAAIISRSPKLQHFRMASCRVGCDGATALATAIRKFARGLVSLDLSDNPFTEGCAEAVARALARQPDLEDLNLSDTGLTDSGVKEVCAALKGRATKLWRLSLGLNELTGEGVQPLTRLLRTCSTLETLELRENELEDEGATLLAKALAMLPELQVLDLSGNQLTRTGALAVTRALCRLGKFRRLELDDNQISEAGVAAVKKLLHQKFGSAAILGSMENNQADQQDDEDEADVVLEEQVVYEDAEYQYELDDDFDDDPDDDVRKYDVDIDDEAAAEKERSDQVTLDTLDNDDF